MNIANDVKPSSRPREQPPGVLIIVENLPVPFDRRVWQEAQALKQAGYAVSVICPRGRGYDARYEYLEGIHIYRHPLPVEASGGIGFLAEYAVALFWEFVLSIRVARRHGFDIIHACNPPDLIFLVGALPQGAAGGRNSSSTITTSRPSSMRRSSASAASFTGSCCSPRS